MFMRMDRPEHAPYRRVVAPIVGPRNLKNMTQMIRDRTCEVLDGLPREEEFDWVENVSVPLTTMMLATLFDFPFEEREKLTYWSDVMVSPLEGPGALVSSETARAKIIGEMGAFFRELYAACKTSEPQFDLLSMLAHSEMIGELDGREFLGTIVLLIVGGNDTTRNSMSSGLLAPQSACSPIKCAVSSVSPPSLTGKIH